METELRIVGYDQGGASKVYIPNIFSLLESGGGGELDGDVLASTEQTPGASELADTVLQKVFGLQRYFFRVSPSLGFKTLRVTPFPVLSTRQVIVAKEDIDNQLRKVENQIFTAFEAEPIEDGYSHSTEVLLEKIIIDFGRHADSWLVSIFSSARWSASMKADLLRLLSRQKPFTEDWRLRVIQIGLSSQNIELRDAAVQAAESWEDPGVIEHLKSHKENCAWLADYISRVLQDLMR